MNRSPVFDYKQWVKFEKGGEIASLASVFSGKY